MRVEGRETRRSPDSWPVSLAGPTHTNTSATNKGTVYWEEHTHHSVSADTAAKTGRATPKGGQQKCRRSFAPRAAWKAVL